jgi:hypothetical protein
MDEREREREREREEGKSCEFMVFFKKGTVSCNLTVYLL